MIAALLPLLGPIIDKVAGAIPDRGEADRLKAQATSEILQAVVGTATQQAEINKTEAASADRFVAGWRPFIGWVCGTSLAYAYIIQPLLSWGLAIWAPTIAPPVIHTDALFELVLAMLGLGGLRTFEKLKGAAR